MRGRQTNKETETGTGTEKRRQTDRQTERQTDRQTDCIELMLTIKHTQNHMLSNKKRVPNKI